MSTGRTGPGYDRHVITFSERATFRACERRWLYRYVQRLSPIEEKAGARTFGSAFHVGGELLDAGAGLDAALDGAKQYLLQHADELEPEEEDLDEASNLGLAQERLAWMVRHYAEVTATERENLVPLLVEEVFVVPIPRVDGRGGPLYGTGRLDRVYFDRAHGDVVVVDRKTKATTAAMLDIERKADVDEQATKYILAVRELLKRGAIRPPDGDLVPDLRNATCRRFVYHVARRAAPREPKVNQNGTVSVAACDTDYATWSAALAAQAARGVTPKPDVAEKQLAISQSLMEQGDRFFARFETYREPWQLERFAADLYVDGARMREAERDPRRATRNTTHCYAYGRGCEFLPICTSPDGDRMDSDARSLYKVRDHRHPELVVVDDREEG